MDSMPCMQSCTHDSPDAPVEEAGQAQAGGRSLDRIGRHDRLRLPRSRAGSGDAIRLPESSRFSENVTSLTAYLMQAEPTDGRAIRRPLIFIVFALA